jgi:hypothetical protein
MFCGECGAQNPDTNRFCRNCGKPLATRQQPGAQPAGQHAATPAVAVGSPVASHNTPAGAATTATRAGKSRRNWTGIVSLLVSIFSWILLTTLLAILAIIIGGFSIYTTRKNNGRISFSGIAAMVIAVVAMAADLMIH